MVDRFIMCCITWNMTVECNLCLLWSQCLALCGEENNSMHFNVLRRCASATSQKFRFPYELLPLSRAASPKSLGIREFADTTPLIHFKGWKYHSELLFSALIRHIGTFIARKHHKFLDFHVLSIRFDDLSLASASNASITICFGSLRSRANQLDDNFFISPQLIQLGFSILKYYHH